MENLCVSDFFLGIRFKESLTNYKCQCPASYSAFGGRLSRSYLVFCFIIYNLHILSCFVFDAHILFCYSVNISSEKIACLRL